MIYFFLDLYYKYIYIIEFVYKCNILCNLWFFVYMYIQFIEFLKYDIYVFSRFFRNIRMNFMAFNVIVRTKFKSYLNKRKHLLFYNISFIKFFGYIFYINLEFLMFKVYRIFFLYNLCLYVVKFKYGLIFFWSDVYSILLDLNDLIIYRELFIFKYEFSKFVFKLYIYFMKFLEGLIFLSFLGFKFFFSLYRFKYKFYIRIF